MPVISVPSAGASAHIALSEVSLSRGALRVLSDVDLAISATSRVALVGENGRGKTTLLHVLAGLLEPDSGTVERAGSCALAEQEFVTAGRRTVGDAVHEAVAESVAALRALDEATADLAASADGADERYAAALALVDSLDAWDAERRVRIALEALDASFAWDRRLDTLSVGQRYRVRLACLLGGSADILLLDEPTNHLDQAGLAFLTAQLRARSGGVVVVTHDRALLADVIDTIVDLDPSLDDRPRVYGGGLEGYRAGRRTERARWEQEHARQAATHAQLTQDLADAQSRLSTGWRPPKGTGKHQRATRAPALVRNVHRRQEALEAASVPIPTPPRALRFPQLPAHGGAVMIELAQVCVDERLAVPISVDVRGGTKLVVHGPNGAGKSTLLALMAGELSPTTGTARRSQSVRIGFLRQEVDLPANARAHELFEQHVGRLVSTAAIRSAQAIGLGSLGLLQPRESSKRIGELSMGQVRRLALAMMLAARPHVLLLDEPTNHLSMTLVDELTHAINTTPAAVVVSTHDRQLLRDLAGWERITLPGAQK